MIAQARYGWQYHLHLPATGTNVSTRSQAYNQAVSHGASSMYSECIVLLNVLAHMGLEKNPNQT